MISLLATLPLCLLPAQNAEPEKVHYEMDIYEIDGLIDLQAEIQEQVKLQWIMQTARLALGEAQKSDDSGSAAGQALTWFALDALLQAEQDSSLEKGAADAPALPLLGSLFAEKNVAYAFRSADDLLETVRTFMSPPFDSNLQGLKIEKSGGRRLLLAYLQPEQRRWLEKFLEYQAQGDQWQAHIRMQAIIAPDKIVLRNGSAANVFGTHQEVLDAGKAFVSAGGELLSAPSLTTLPGQKGVMTIMNQVAYVSGWDFTVVQPSGAKIADPTIEVIEDGISLSARVFQVGEDLFGISVEAELARVAQPFESKILTVEGKDYEIGMPEVISVKMATAALLPNGGGVLLRSPDFQDGKDLILLVSFQKVVNTEKK